MSEYVTLAKQTIVICFIFTWSNLLGAGMNTLSGWIHFIYKRTVHLNSVDVNPICKSIMRKVKLNSLYGNN